MDSDWSKAAELWLSEFGWSELDRDGFTQVDIDWFSDRPPAQPVPAALACAQAALTSARTRYPQLVPLVTVPLEFSDTLDLEPPDLARILGSDWKYGSGLNVVGVYLVSPAQLAPGEAVEEYRRPLDSAGLLPAPFVASYRCWRDVTDDWIEYDRTIYIHTPLSS